MFLVRHWNISGLITKTLCALLFRNQMSSRIRVAAAKLLIDDKNTSLADPLINMLVVLRMNKSFMEFMRSNKNARDGVTIIPGLAN